jgi:hypothetical protein
MENQETKHPKAIPVKHTVIIPRLDKWEKVCTIEGCTVYKSFEYGVTRLAYVAKLHVDCDGMPYNKYQDPCYQRETSLFYSGSPIDADKVPYIVVPPKVRNCVEPVVMGCMSFACNLKKGLVVNAVVADQGPPDKLGEASCECARRIGLDGNPNDGGTDEHEIFYLIWPGIPATVDGVTYNLSPS